MDRFKNRSVLVVDDDIESLECMCEYLDIEFSLVYRATNAKDALEIVISKKPDIIFTDILMPGIDGFSLIEQINSIDSKIPVVVISAYDDKEKLFRAIKTDIVDYLIKPLTSLKLKETMRLCSKRFEKNGRKILLKDNFVWDGEKSLLSRSGKILKLTKSETRIMETLTKNIDSPVNSIDLFYSLCDFESREFNSKNIRNVIYKIRKKLKNKDLIENIYGSKYMIRSKR